MKSKRSRRAVTAAVLLAMTATLSLSAYGEETAEVLTQAAFYEELNEALGYIFASSEEEGCISRQEAAHIIYEALNYSDVAESTPDDDFLDIREIREAAYLASPFEDVKEDSAYFKEIAALWYYDALDISDGVFRPEDALTENEAQAMITNALTSTITVADGEDEIVRDKMIVPVKLGILSESANSSGFSMTQTLETGTASLTEDDMLVPMNIGSLIGGSVKNNGNGNLTIIMGGTPDGENMILNEASFDADENGRISLKAVADAFGGTFAIEGDTAVVTFPRHILKSNRNLTDEEKTYSYTKFYLEYWQTPLPERADEVAWAKEQVKYDAENPSKEAGGTLYPPTYYKMVEDGYDPYEEEGWSVSADGKWASICVVSPIKGELEDAEAFSWWFAWHGLRDVRYMTWYPPAHWGLGIQNGNDAGRDGNNPNTTFRSFNTELTISQRSYGLGHSVAEDTTRTSYNGSTAWIDVYLNKAKPAVNVNTGLNFKDLTNMTDTVPMGSSDGISFNTHFSVNAENTERYETWLLEEPQQIGTVGFSGQYMCHFLRWNKETKQAEIITHFSSYNPQGWQNGGASMPGLAMHATREFARLADILVELYQLEGATPLQDDYDERSYVFEPVPDETTAHFYAAVNEIAGTERMPAGNDASLTRAEAAKVLYSLFGSIASEEEIQTAWEETPAYLKFSDVDETTDGYQEILALHYYEALDIISGTFRPQDNLSTTEAEKLLANIKTAVAVLPVGQAVIEVDHVRTALDQETVVCRDGWEMENIGSSSGAAVRNETPANPAEESASESTGESAEGEATGKSAEGESASESADSTTGSNSSFTVDDVLADPLAASALGMNVDIDGSNAVITFADSVKILPLNDGKLSLRAFTEAFAQEAGLSITFRANILEDGTVTIYEAVIKADRKLIDSVLLSDNP